jgi:hypothetical protein
LNIKQFIFSAYFLCIKNGNNQTSCDIRIEFLVFIPLRIETEMRIPKFYEFGKGKIPDRPTPLSCLAVGHTPLAIPATGAFNFLAGHVQAWQSLARSSLFSTLPVVMILHFAKMGLDVSEHRRLSFNISDL